MKVRRRFLLALFASLMLHLIVVSGPGWRVPGDDEPGEPVLLDAQLVTPAPSARPSAATPAPRPAPKRRAPAPKPAAKLSGGDAPPASPEPAEAPAAPESAAQEPPVASAAAEPVPASPPAAIAPKDIALPRYARIRYNVTWGEVGVLVGQAVQIVRHDATAYRLSSTAETIGIFGLFRPATMTNVSEGDLVEGGLRPRRFKVERSSGKNESAVLDWESGQVKGSGGRVFPLEPGTQDPLSMFCQLALVPIDGPTVSLPVVTGKGVERYHFEVLGEESIQTPRGPRATLHLRNRQPDGKEATEIWIGLEDARLPVKIRHVDRRGDTFEQLAASIEYEEEGTR